MTQARGVWEEPIVPVTLGSVAERNTLPTATAKDGRLTTVSPVACVIVYVFVLNFSTELARHIKSQLI